MENKEDGTVDANDDEVKKKEMKPINYSLNNIKKEEAELEQNNHKKDTMNQEIDTLYINIVKLLKSKIQKWMKPLIIKILILL